MKRLLSIWKVGITRLQNCQAPSTHTPYIPVKIPTFLWFSLCHSPLFALTFFPSISLLNRSKFPYFHFYSHFLEFKTSFAKQRPAFQQYLIWYETFHTPYSPCSKMQTFYTYQLFLFFSVCYSSKKKQAYLVGNSPLEWEDYSRDWKKF